MHQGMTLVSFDIVSLFTKVPVNLAAKVARERLTADQSLVDCTALSPDEVVGLLEFYLGATYLSYRGETFQQVFGTAMGSPSLCHSGQPGDGGCRAKGSHFL